MKNTSAASPDIQYPVFNAVGCYQKASGQSCNFSACEWLKNLLVTWGEVSVTRALQAQKLHTNQWRWKITCQPILAPKMEKCRSQLILKTHIPQNRSSNGHKRMETQELNQIDIVTLEDINDTWKFSSCIF